MPGRLRQGLHAAFATALVLASASCHRTDERASVVFLLVDTLRWDHLGATGFPGAISPHIDSIAQESVLFTSCFAQAPWTPPSVATVFTSLYPQVHGLHRFEDHRFRDPRTGQLRASVLPEEAVTLAEVLRDAGYDTAAFVANPWLAHGFGFEQGFDVYDDTELGKRTPASMLTVPARDWLAGRAAPRPFFLYLHFMDVHEPYDSSREDFEALRASIADDRPLAAGELPPAHMEIPALWVAEQERSSLAYWKTRYAAEVRELDARLASLLEHLRESGALDRSWLVLTSDHGEELFEHAGWSHGESLHGHQLRVPLLVRPPGGLPAPRRIEHPVRLIDVMPTVLSLLGLERPSGLQGVDLAGSVTGRAAGNDALPLYATGIVDEPGVFALQSGRHKLIADFETGSTSLYDLAADAGETLDIAAAEPEIVARMRDLLDSHIADTTAARILEPRIDFVPPQLQQQIEALGYVD